MKLTWCRVNDLLLPPLAVIRANLMIHVRQRLSNGRHCSLDTTLDVASNKCSSSPIGTLT